MRHNEAYTFLICIMHAFYSLIGVTRLSTLHYIKNSRGRLSGLVSYIKGQVFYFFSLYVILFFLNFLFGFLCIFFGKLFINSFIVNICRNHQLFLTGHVNVMIT